MKPSKLFETYGWCKGSSARDGDNNPVSPFDTEAKSFCAVGAFMKCYPAEKGSFSRCISKLTTRIGVDITEWNDSVCLDKEELVRILKSIGE